jgi:biopolymer transport protein ExbD
MTPMIDIVFQLLTFFIMSLKISAAEGDFAMRFPAAGVGRDIVGPCHELPPFRLRMTANADGSLQTLRLDHQTLGANLADDAQAEAAFAALHREVIARLGDDRGPGSIAAAAEVEFDCDYELDYGNVIAAITAIAGYVSPEDNQSVVKLIEKIKFAPPRMVR